MFERAQEAIGRGKFTRGGVADMTLRAKRLQGGDGAAFAQRRLAPAQDQLLGLREKLDLADAAAPELDIVAGDRDIAMTDMGVDLPLDGMDVLDSGEIEIAPPDEGFDGGEKARSGGGVAGTGARLDQRRALPVLPHLFVIGFGRFRRDRDLGGARVGRRRRSMRKT